MKGRKFSSPLLVPNVGIHHSPANGVVDVASMFFQAGR